MNRKRLLINVGRILVFGVLVVVLYHLIHLHDEVHVKSRALTVPASEASAEADGYRIRGEFHKTGDIEYRPGFITLFKRIDRRLFFLVAPIFLLTYVVCGYRWWLLLRALGFEVSLKTILTVTYIGGFFNIFLPGAVGGDIAKAVIATQGEERKAALVGSILLDRIVGLMAMILIAAVCILPFVTDPSLRQPVILLGVLFFGMVAGYAVYFSPAIRNLLGGLKDRGKVGAVLHDLDTTFQLLKHRKGVVVQCLALSALAQSISIVGSYGLSRAMGMTAPSLLQFFAFDPIVFIATAVPIVPGGWGVQEGAFAFLFGKVGVPKTQSVALSILYKLTLVFISVPGGILFALGAARRRRESGTRPQIPGPAGDVPAHR